MQCLLKVHCDVHKRLTICPKRPQIHGPYQRKPQKYQIYLKLRLSINFKEDEEDNENKSGAEQADHSESEDSSRKSSTGKDFEMVEASWLEEHVRNLCACIRLHDVESVFMEFHIDFQGDNTEDDG